MGYPSQESREHTEKHCAGGVSTQFWGATAASKHGTILAFRGAREGSLTKNAGNLGKFTKFALILGFLAHKINVLDSFLAPLPSPRPLELLMESLELYMNSWEVLQEFFFLNREPH